MLVRVFLRERNDGQPADFRPNPQTVPRIKNTRKSFSEGLEQVIPDEVSDTIMEAVGKHQILIEKSIDKSSFVTFNLDQIYLTVLYFSSLVEGVYQRYFF